MEMFLSTITELLRIIIQDDFVDYLEFSKILEKQNPAYAGFSYFTEEQDSAI